MWPLAETQACLDLKTILFAADARDLVPHDERDRQVPGAEEYDTQKPAAGECGKKLRFDT